MTIDEVRRTLTRHHVMEAAVALADAHGIGAVSMRRLGQELGVEAMSLYTHVRSKEDLLDGMVECVMEAFPRPAESDDWQSTLRGTILGSREVLVRHPWAPAVIETRTEPGPLMLAHYDAVMGILRRGGFSLELAHHALHLLGSRLLGFTQDLFDDSPDLPPEATTALAARLRPTLPYVAEMALRATHEGGLGGCDTDVEFSFSLDVILDGLERLRR
ncbi:MAG TPA: TetR/AcrR family transcriptional regulator C-terminal domain-containing protein [Candidatus Baltobacteraceae bacterium]|nr:TetR/AcrR family transcriptional regulator C-terminal domain-containing protein [Candidatus Baltobacteraceae bacterium]